MNQQLSPVQRKLFAAFSGWMFLLSLLGVLLIFGVVLWHAHVTENQPAAHKIVAPATK